MHEDYPNQILLMVFDERTRDAYGGAYPIPEPGQPAPFLISGATLAELTRNIGRRLRAAGVSFEDRQDARPQERADYDALLSG